MLKWVDVEMIIAFELHGFDVNILLDFDYFLLIIFFYIKLVLYSHMHQLSGLVAVRYAKDQSNSFQCETAFLPSVWSKLS